MKKNKWLSLLCLLLGASTVLGACDGGTSGSSSSSSETSTDVATQVEAKFANFIQTEDKDGWNGMQTPIKALNDEYGTCIGSCKSVYLFQKEDKNFLNEIVQTWMLFDIKTNKVVWTKEHKYEDGDYTGYDEYGNAKHAPVEMTVELRETYKNGYTNDPIFAFVEVCTSTYERYSKEQLEEWKDKYDYVENSYKETQTTEWISADGKLIASTNFKYAEAGEWLSEAGDNYRLDFGRTEAEFDENGKLLSTWNSESEIKKIYFKETDKYGYATTMCGGVAIAEVYHKADGSLVYSKSYDIVDAMLSGGMSLEVLENGDLFSQSEDAVSGATYDYLKAGSKVKLTTTRIDVETGKESEVAFGYNIVKLIDKAKWEKEHPELSFTDNVYNVATAQKVENGALGDEVLIFFDNALNVQYEWAPLIPEQVDLENIDVLPSGDLVVQLETPIKNASNDVVDRAVVTTDGELVCYLTEDAFVFDESIMLCKDGMILVYNFDGEMVFNHNALMNWDDWSFRGRLGDTFVFNVHRTNTHWEDGFEQKEEENKLLVFYESEHYVGGEYIDGEYVGGEYQKYLSYMTKEYNQIVEMTNDYIIEKTEDGQYRLYDSSYGLNYYGSGLLVTREEMKVQKYDDCFVVETEYEGETIVYVIDFEQEIVEDDGDKHPGKDEGNSSYKGGDEE